MNLSPELMSLLMSYGPIVAMVVIFYFMLYKPQKKEQQRRKDMLDSLKKGNRVITIGGIYGEITAVKENSIMVRIAEKVEIEMTRAAVNTNISHEKSSDK